jgi:hypothetical protein
MKEPHGLRGSFTVRNHGGTRQSGPRTKPSSNAAVYGKPQVKKGPSRGPCRKVEDSRRRRKTAAACPLKRPRLIITSKMAVNFIVVSGQQNVVVSPHERPFRLLLTNQLEFVIMLSGVSGESSYEPKILPSYLGDILRRLSLQYSTR